MTFEIGQKLYFVYSDNRRGNPTHATVSKIGRRWINVEPNYLPRFDTKTMYADGGQYSCPGMYWLSKEQYESETASVELWRKFAKLAGSYHKPDGVTAEQIHNAAAALGFNL